MNIHELQPHLKSYQLKKILGEGNYSRVFKVSSKETQEKYALKVYFKSLLKSHQKEIENEVFMVKNLDHPHIVCYLERFKINDYTCLLFELCEQRTLGDIMKITKYPEFNNVMIKICLKQIFLALSYLKQKSIVHRDIKPNNILFKDNSIKLCDFNLSTFEGSRKTRAGTPYYMSPEIIRENLITCGADVWSVGVVLYEIVFDQRLNNTENKDIYFGYIMYMNFKYPKTSFPKSGLNLMENLFNKNHKKRLTAEMALYHPFLN